MFLMSCLLHLAIATPPQSFAHLKEVTIPGASLYVDPSVQCTPKVIELEGDIDVYNVCTVTIGKGTQAKDFFVLYTEGPSDDPSFDFVLASSASPVEDKSQLSIGATSLYIPKGSNVYSEGWVNNMFNHRRKFTYDGQNFKEVEQPLLYVGIKSTVTAIEGAPVLKLYASQDKKNTVAILPPGSDIEVVLHDAPDWYLVRSSFGLVGWVHVEEGSMYMNQQIGVYFKGD